MEISNDVGDFVQKNRKAAKLSQAELAQKAGVGVRFIRDLEQGKKTLRLDKVNQVLVLFGQILGASPIDRNKLIHEKSPDISSK
jgi:y4mF family transcriptional regulator